MSFASVLAANATLLYTQAITALGLASAPIAIQVLTVTTMAALTLATIGLIGYGFYLLAKKLSPAQDIPPQEPEIEQPSKSKADLSPKEKAKQLKKIQAELDAARVREQENSQQIQAEYEAALLQEKEKLKQDQAEVAVRGKAIKDKEAAIEAEAQEQRNQATQKTLKENAKARKKTEQQLAATQAKTKSQIDNSLASQAQANNESSAASKKAAKKIVDDLAADLGVAQPSPIEQLQSTPSGVEQLRKEAAERYQAQVDQIWSNVAKKNQAMNAKSAAIRKERDHINKQALEEAMAVVEKMQSKTPKK